MNVIELYESSRPLSKQVTHTNGIVYCSINPTDTVTGRMACVDSDTLIEAPRDLSKHPDGIPLNRLAPGDYIYSFDRHRELCVKRIKWVGPTGVKPTLIVHTDKGQPLVLSPDHLVRGWLGQWIRAKNIKPGNKLLCMPSRGRTETGYYYLYPHTGKHGGSRCGGKVYEHRFVTEQCCRRKIRGNSLIRHTDSNPGNNTFSNLQWVKGTAAHKILHSYTANLDLLEKAACTGRGKTGKILSPRTIYQYYRELARLRQNHIVTKVEPGPEKLLWNMEVEDTQCFIGNGVALHNSRLEDVITIEKKSGWAEFLCNISAPDVTRFAGFLERFTTIPVRVMLIYDYSGFLPAAVRAPQAKSRRSCISIDVVRFWLNKIMCCYRVPVIIMNDYGNVRDDTTEQVFQMCLDAIRHIA